MKLLNWIKNKFSRPVRLELRFLPYSEGDRLIRETNGAWTIAKEEDNNRVFGWVYVELLEKKP